MARRATLIKATRQEHPNVLLLDAGDSLYGSQSLTLQSNGKVIVEGMNKLGYDAMLIGDLDLRYGPEVLAQRIAEASFPALSANVLRASDKQLVGKPYIITEVGGRKVGIIGITWDGIDLQDPLLKDNYVVLKADIVLPQYVTEVSRKADIVIVLSNMGLEEDQRLSSAVAGIDVILGGRSRNPMEASWRNQKTGTIVAQAGAQGEWIGRRTLTIDGSGVVKANRGELIYLTDDYADDTDIRTWLDNYTVQ